MYILITLFCLILFIMWIAGVFEPHYCPMQCGGVVSAWKACKEPGPLHDHWVKQCDTCDYTIDGGIIMAGIM